MKRFKLNPDPLFLLMFFFNWNIFLIHLSSSNNLQIENYEDDIMADK